VIDPLFYKNTETLTVGIICPDCPMPNLVFSVCIEGMDFLETLQVGQRQCFAWVEHRRAVHGEILQRSTDPGGHLGATEL